MIAPYARPVSVRRFPLRAPRAIYWAIPFFGAGAVLFALKLGTDRGVNIGDLVHLGVTGARVFYGVIAAVSFAFVALAILCLAAMRGGRLAVELGEESIVVPGSVLRPRRREFCFAEIRITLAKEFLSLFDARGTGWVARSHVGDAAFDAIVAHVAARVKPLRATLPIAKLL